MQGRRLKNVTDENMFPDHSRAGDYWLDETMNVWWCHLPTGGVTSLAGYQVTEHEDKTITVGPAIIGRWNGYLERGVWRDITTPKT